MQEFISMWKNIFNFKGRARRKEYWIGYLWVMLIMIVLMIPEVIGVVVMDTNESVGTVIYVGGIILALIGGLPLSLAFISLTVRRYHDVGLAGWWYLVMYLLSACGVGGIIHLIILCIDSNEDNKWGPNPKQYLQNNGNYNYQNDYQNNGNYNYQNDYQNNGNYNYQNDYQNNGNYNYQNGYQNNDNYNQQNNSNGNYTNNSNYNEYNENSNNFQQ